jgi:peptide/nickel transport system permease protein
MASRMARRFLEHRLALASLAILVLLALASLAAPLVELALGVDAGAANLFDRFAPAGAEHLLGTDELGRDLAVRLLYTCSAPTSWGATSRCGCCMAGGCRWPSGCRRRCSPRRSARRSESSPAISAAGWTPS